MTTEPIYVDNSILTHVAVCDTQTVIRYILGYTTREERATLLSGTAGHEALATYFRTGDAAATMEKFTEVYHDWAVANLEPQHGRSWENTSTVLRTWLEAHPLGMLPFAVLPDWVEIGFSFPLTDDGTIVFVGRIDAIVQDLDSGHLRVLDHKFPGRVDGQFAKQYRMDSQFSGYIWAGQQQLGTPIDGGFVNGVEFSRLPSDPNRKCPKHAVPFAECGFMHVNSAVILVNRTPQQIARWRADAIRLARRYADLKAKYSDPAYLPAVPMQGQFVYRACSNCEALDFCAAGKPVQQLDSLFQHQPWEPWLHSGVKDEPVQS